MTHQTLLEIGSVFSLVTTGIGVVFVMVTHRRQVNASIYLDLTSRLQRLYQSIPAETRSSYFTASGGDASPRAIDVLVMDFLNLMSAAYTLHKTDYFVGPLWKALEAEAKHGLHTPLFRDQWPLVCKHFSSHPEFVRYVDKIQQP